MDKFDRIFQLHSIFKARKTSITGPDLMKNLECSRSTLHRSLELMKDVLRAPIEFDPDSGGYRYSTTTGAYELPGLWFSAGELQALMLIERLIKDAGGGMLEEQLKPLARRLSELTNHKRLNLNHAATRLRFPVLAGRPAGPAFQPSLSALLQRKKMRIQYHARGTDQKSSRLISPQRIVHYRESWYLDAWDETKAQLRSFAIDRILNTTLSEELARDIPEADLDAHFAASFGIFGGEPDKVAVLHFSAERARWVADELWHPKKEARYLEDGRYELKIPYRDARELVMDILRHGSHVQVVSPQDLRQEVRQQLKDALERYAHST